MSPEKQRIAIAEACGWRYAGPSDVKEHAVACWYAPGDMEWHQRLLPDYLNDLNAMHEAENVLSRAQAKTFAEKMQDVCRWHCIGIIPDWHHDREALAHLIHATAAQRAEAFLRTLNLWEEQP